LAGQGVVGAAAAASTAWIVTNVLGRPAKVPAARMKETRCLGSGSGMRQPVRDQNL
jgi:hypothetical protein